MDDYGIALAAGRVLAARAELADAEAAAMVWGREHSDQAGHGYLGGDESEPVRLLARLEDARAEERDAAERLQRALSEAGFVTLREALDQ